MRIILCDDNLEDKARADLYILDIDMPEISGIALAKQIQNIQPQAFVYFYTSHSEFATEGYRVEARRYLLKGGNPAFFTEAIEFACDQVAKRRQSQTSLPFYHETINVPISDTRISDNLYYIYGEDTEGRSRFVIPEKGTGVSTDAMWKKEKDSLIVINFAKVDDGYRFSLTDHIMSYYK